MSIRIPSDLEKVLRKKAKDDRTTISFLVVGCLRKKFNLPSDNDLNDGSLLG